MVEQQSIYLKRAASGEVFSCGPAGWTRSAMEIIKVLQSWQEKIFQTKFYNASLSCSFPCIRLGLGLGPGKDHFTKTCFL